jgi:phosphoserine phosphatase
MIDTLFPDHPFEEVFTNKIGFDGSGTLVSWKATPFDLHGKPVALRALVKKFKTSLERAAFVGDGDNDVPLLGVAGYFVAFNPRSPELEERADTVIKERDLRTLLEIFK